MKFNTPPGQELFWNYVYKYTYTSKYTKNFYIHCAGLHLSLTKLDYRPDPSLMSKSHCCTAPFTSVRNIRFSSRRLVSIILPEYLISTSLQNSVEYMISSHLPDLHRSTLCISGFLEQSVLIPVFL